MPGGLVSGPSSFELQPGEIVARDYLEATRPLIEATIGRRLRKAEQVVDVFALTRALDDTKDLLHAAIRAEQRRKVRGAIRTGHGIQLEVTRAMLTPLEKLYRLGAREAFAELQRAGYNPSRAYMDAEPSIPELGEVHAKLRSRLNGFAARLNLIGDEIRVQQHVSSDGSIADALAAALLNQPGGRSIAAALVSTTLFTGMAPTFEQNADLVQGWEYSAVLDGGTCEECEPHDGEFFDTLDALFEVLPNFGPNPACLGEDRCRCRAVPA